MSIVRGRALLVLSALVLVPLLAGAVYLGIRFPAAAIPALIGALFGAQRVYSRTSEYPVLPPVQDQWLRIYGACTWPALLLGAVGYAALAALGIGVPNQEATVFWRLFGGAVFGALAGVIAGWAVALVTELVLTFRSARRLRRERAA